VLGDAGLVATAATLGAWIATLPYGAPDLMGGTAGRLRMHLALWDATAEEGHLHAAIAAGDALLAAGEETSTGLCWPLPAGYAELSGKIYVGYAHGAAGIADTLLDLFEATRKERFRAAAQDAGHWIAGLAMPALPDGSGLAWPRGAGDALAESFWCHGAAGIGQFFLHAATLGVMPQAMELAARSARTAARGARSAGPTLCHGLAGNIELLIDMFQASGDWAYLSEARSLARLLETFLIEQDDALAESSAARQNLPPSYMLGYAGVMTCMLRLAEPERLSGCFFRHPIVRAPTACSAPPAPASGQVGSARRPS
jgi:lantibiotic modifying enzyme